TGGLVPGRASVVQHDGRTNADMTVLGDAGTVVAWPAERSGGRRGRGRRPGGDDDDPAAATKKARQRIDDAFAHCRAWLDRSMVDPTTPPDLRAQALVPALRGETPVFLLANDLEQIESAVLWATGRELRPVIVGGQDAALCTELLVQYEVPVILTGTHRLPRRDDADYDEPFALPALLAGRGVKFCIATGEEFAHERNLPYHAATAAAFGLDRERALAAITRDAAAILGVGDRLGTLTPGKLATLFVADGNPLELTTRIDRAWIQGREVDLRNKQTELADKYRRKYRDLDAGK
ncbi:MAG: amidohydrolase family protein, partial [Planctomycetota bacterium]